MPASTDVPTKNFSQLEAIEAVAWADLYRWAPNNVGTALGIGTESSGTARMVRASAFDVLALNRVIGLGIDAEITSAELERTVDWYRDGGVGRFFIQVAPEAPHAPNTALLARHGLRHHNNWVKLCRDVHDAPTGTGPCTMTKIGPNRARDFGEVLCTSFDWQRSAIPWIACLVGAPGWHHYLASVDGRAVATGALFHYGRMAWLDFASTLPGQRGLGAQTALIGERIHLAQTLGCDTLVVESAEETPTRGAPSFRNLRRLGFQIAYVRPNYIWEGSTKSI